jgi:electron transfer flavoprotein alpha subunit
MPYEDASRFGEVQAVELNLDDVAGRLTWLSMDAHVALPVVPLPEARVLVSAGRGLQDADGFALVEKLADALGGAIVGSRGAFDEGWITEEQIVGIGGASVAPDLYVACGLSGDIYHYFGLQDAKFVLAINPDENAPIMKWANMAVVGDAKEIIPAMLEALAS